MLHVKTPSSAMLHGPLGMSAPLGMNAPLGMSPPMGTGAEPDAVDWRGLFRAARRRLGRIVTLALAAMIAAGVYVVLRAPQYTAHTDLQLTNLKLTFSRDDALFAESLLDPSFLDTQMQLMRSDKILIAVVERLHLDAAESVRAPGLVQEARAQLAALGLPIPAPRPQTEEERRWEAVRQLQRVYTVERVGTSNIVVIRVAAPEREEAARLANEIARAYIDDQTAARAEIAQSASIWLRERLRDVGPKTRIVAAATAPAEKSNPSGLLIVVLAGLVGGLAGLTWALARHCFDGTVRSPEQAAAASGAECLGVVPVGRISRFASRNARSGAGADCVPARVAALEVALRDPTSGLARTLAHMKATLDASLAPDAPRWIGITSVSSDEGASTVALAFARSLARSGARTLLIDCDGFRHTLSRSVAADEGPGLREVLAGEVPDLQAALRKDASGRLHILSHGGASETGAAAGVWSEGMRQVLASTAQTYDYVLCDLPPLGAAAEVRVAARYLNGFLLVVEGGKSAADHLRAAVTTLGPFREMLLGVILNKVCLSDLRRSGSPVATVFAGSTGRSRRLSRNLPASRPAPADNRRTGRGAQAEAEA